MCTLFYILIIFQQDQTISSDELHVFLDPIQFAVIQQKSVALDEILKQIKLKNQNR